MEVRVKESTVVRPAEETPKQILWTSNIDQMFRFHLPSVYFYKPDGSANFFDASVLKDALSKVLVPFYPVAGRVKKREENGRLEIECNGEGALFVEASTDSNLKDLGDFSPSRELGKLIPTVDYTVDITSHPILLLQVTYFKCGGVSLGARILHTALDGVSAIYFMNSWSLIARGLSINIPPFIDRTLLRAREPPTPMFPHIEYQLQPPPPPQTTPNTFDIATFNITREHINHLKEKCTKESNLRTVFSSYEVLAGHVWRCLCKARDLGDDEELNVLIPVDGRARLCPPLPLGYLGNAVFHMKPKAIAAELLSKTLVYAVQKIHETVVRADNEYLKSALDYLEVQEDLSAIGHSPHSLSRHNFDFSSWCRMPIHETDFGWGRPIYMGPGPLPFEGIMLVLPSPIGDGSQSLIVTLNSRQMEIFKELIYDM